MSFFATRGHRPLAWWQYDAPEGLQYSYDTERSTLYEAGLLSSEEREQLLLEWRQEFTRALAPNFMYCAGLRPDGGGALWLYGQAAREAHLQWADVPQSLVKRWTAERRATIA